MYIKQINAAQALELASKGMEIMTLVPCVPEAEAWTDYNPVMLQDMLNGCLFFRKEPAMEAPILEKDIPELPEDIKQEKKVRKELDMGKIRALKKAGWGNRKIADEMGVSESTVWNRLNQMGVDADASARSD